MTPDSSPVLVVQHGDRYVRVADLGFEANTLQEFIELGADAQARLADAIAKAPDDAGIAVDDAVYGPGTINPPSILAVGQHF